MSPQPWTIMSSETLVADRWIRLRADACIDGDGRTIAPYYVLEYGDWVSVLAIDDDGQAIVVEEYRHGAGVTAVGTIGGGVEPGERAADAARRELLEETGCAAEELIDLGATWANFGNQPNRVHHFLARGCRVVADPSPDEGESIAVHVLPLGGLDQVLHQSYHQLTWFKAQEHLGR